MKTVVTLLTMLFVLSLGTTACAEPLWPFHPNELGAYVEGKWPGGSLIKKDCQEPSELGVNVCNYKFLGTATLSAYGYPGSEGTRTLTLVCDMKVCDEQQFAQLATEVVKVFNFEPASDTSATVNRVLANKTLTAVEGGYAFFTTQKHEYRFDTFWKPRSD